MHEVLVNRLGGQSLPRKSVVRLPDRPDMTLDAYRGRKTTKQQQQQQQQIHLYVSRRHRVTNRGQCQYVANIYGTPEVTFPFRYLSEKKLKQGN